MSELKVQRKGWWATHEYHRRKVEDIEEFFGWQYLQDLVQKIEAKHGFEKAALPCFLFEGGFRIGEAVLSSDGKSFGGLRKENIMLQGEFIVFKGCRRLKGYEKLKTYYESKTEQELPENKLRRLFFKDDRTGLYMRKRFETRSLVQRRDFAFPKNEPLAKPLLDYWREWKDDILFPFTATRSYQILIETDRNIWNHWFRSQRASQLVAEYNWQDAQLMRFFEWKDAATARRYARKGVGDVIRMFPSAGTFARIVNRPNPI